MAFIIAAVLGVIALAWFLRRLFPALFAAVFVLFAPVWLVGGALLDLLRRPLAFLRPVGVIGQQSGEHFEAGDDVRFDRRRERRDVLEDSVDPPVHRERVRGGSQMNVARSRGLRLPRHVQRARLKNRFAQQHARRDRRARIVSFVEILVRAPRALRRQAVGRFGYDFVHKQKRRTVRDEVSDLGHVDSSGE